MGERKLKAVIMAGGLGKRLNPITDPLPKPLAPVGGIACIRHIISLLKKYGICDICISVMYQAEQIRRELADCNDVNLRFFEESSPMGTAGSVKNCAEFLDGDFLVISGDCLCDFDLSAAIDFHFSHAGAASILFTRVKEPLEYGVALIGEDGKVSRFIEKPSWSRVYSDTVNTGIYLFSQKIFDFISLKDGACDFGKDVFPLMMQRGESIYGKVMDGYWCDIGDCRAYLQANLDYLSGKIENILPFGQDPSALNASVCGRCLVGEGTAAEGAVIGPNVVIGKNCRLEQGARVENSVLMDGVVIEKNASVRFGVIGSGSRISEGASVGEFSVVGQDCNVGKNSVVSAGTRIHAGNTLPDGVQISGNVFTYFKEPLPDGGKMVFPRAEVYDSTFYMKTGAAFATVFGGEIAVGISSSECLAAEMSLDAGLVGAGGNVFLLGVCGKNMLRYTVRKYGFRGGIYFSCDEKQIAVSFYAGDGLALNRNDERKFERALSSCDFKTGNGSCRPFDGFKILYRRHIRALLGRQRPIKALVIAPTALSENLTVKNTPGLERIFVGEDEIFVYRAGKDQPAYSPEQVKAVLTYVFGYYFGKVYLPYDYPFICDEVARLNGFTVERLTLESENRRLMYDITDTEIAAAILLRYLSAMQCSFGEIAGRLPSFCASCRMVETPGAKAEVMRGLSEESREKAEFVEGIRLLFPEEHRGVWIIPENRVDRFRLYAEAESFEAAEEICDFYAKKIGGEKKET